MRLGYEAKDNVTTPQLSLTLWESFQSARLIDAHKMAVDVVYVLTETFAKANITDEDIH
jgi:hypothetical protein